LAIQAAAAVGILLNVHNTPTSTKGKQEATSPCTIYRSLVYKVPTVPPGIYTSLQR
jgi:hypothetical protein